MFVFFFFLQNKIIYRCFETWQRFIQNEQLNKQIEEEKSKAKIKMQSFLEAASQGKLNTTVQEDKSISESSNVIKKKQPNSKTQRSVKTPKQKRPSSAQYLIPTLSYTFVLIPFHFKNSIISTK